MHNDCSRLLYQVIQLTCDLPEPGLTCGTRGTIVLIFEEAEPAFEVEFTDDEGRTVAQLPLTRDAFDLVRDPNAC